MINIRGTSELQNVVREVKANLADSTIEPIEAGIFHSNHPFIENSEVGPWDDHLFYEFRCCSCSARFSLSVETYHGTDGSWTSDDYENPA
jgi:hypothetical protein